MFRSWAGSVSGTITSGVERSTIILKGERLVPCVIVEAICHGVHGAPPLVYVYLYISMYEKTSYICQNCLGKPAHLS